MTNYGIIFDIKRGSYEDGPGIRTTIFFKGCNLRCRWCHNPESLQLSPQIMYFENLCVHCGRCKKYIANCVENKCTACGKCVEVCVHGARKIIGKYMTVKEVFDVILKDRDFFDTSGGGVTFSGGECMLQSDFLLELLLKCKQNNISTAIDTAGNVPFKIFEKIDNATDLYLYDVKCITEQLHIQQTGVSNKLILSNLVRLAKLHSDKITVRVPVIGGFNENETELNLIKGFISAHRISSVEYLPYHNMGESKKSALFAHERFRDAVKKEIK